jgi:hypothetical protein
MMVFVSGVIYGMGNKIGNVESIRRGTYFAQCCTSWKMMNSG